MDNPIKEIVDGIISAVDKERKESEPYKDLFRSSDDLESLIYHLDNKMVAYVLNASTILKEKFGYEKTPDEAFHILMAVPILLSKVRKHVEVTQGRSCCADKARYHVANMLRQALEDPQKPGEGEV